MEQALPDALDMERDPCAQWLLLEKADGCPDPDGRLEAARLWWCARYAFADKKRTRVRDKFVWLLAGCAGWGSGGYFSTRELQKLCAEVLESPELDAACAASDELYAQLLDASMLYVATLLPVRTILGVMSRRDKDNGARNSRVSALLFTGALHPLALCCVQTPRMPVLLRALYAAAINTCPGILPCLHRDIQDAAEDSTRALLGAALQDAQNG